MKKGKILIGFLVTLVLLYVLLRQVSVGEVYDVLKGISFSSVLVGFLIYILIYFFRSFRFMTLLSGKIKLSKLFTIVCLHNLANMVLPMRSGEVSYVYFAKKEGVDSSEGIATLVLARVFDFISILFIFVLGYFYLENPPGSVLDALVWFFIVVFLLVVFLVSLVVFKLRLKVLFEKFLRLFSIESRLVKGFQRKVGQVVDAFRSIGFNRLALLVLVESLIIWVLMFYFAYYVLSAFGMELTVIEMMVAGSIGLFILMLPVHGILGFGTTEAAFTIAFLILGFEKNLVIAVGFGYHILSLLFGVLMGIYGVLSYKMFNRKTFK